MAQVAGTSPYVYLATFFFALSAVSSDLLFLRGALTFGFLFLLLSSLSGFSKNGSFSYVPLSDGIVDITMFVNMILFLLNAFIFVRLIQDERPKGAVYNDQEKALFRFFQSRCGLTSLQFQHILKNGSFLELKKNTDVPNCHCTLYLVLEGKVTCRAKFNQDVRFGKSFIKRSGEFFDIKLFNLFSIPIGFDNVEFHARTMTKTKLFYWNVNGLINMRDLQSPSLNQYWEFLVLRALTSVAVRHHLKATDTIYDSLLIPEHQSWLEGAPSRDFWKQEKPVGNWEHLKRQLAIIRASLWRIIPPHGVRHRPGILQPNPKQAYMELVCKATAPRSDAEFRFLQQTPEKKQKEQQEEAEDESGKFHFLEEQPKHHDVETADKP